MVNDDQVTAMRAAIDQMSALMSLAAEAVAAYHRELRNKGLSRIEATELALAYQERVFDAWGFGLRKGE